MIDYNSGWCKSCYRTLQEIARWSTMTAEQRAQVLAAIEARRDATE